MNYYSIFVYYVVPATVRFILKEDEEELYPGLLSSVIDIHDFMKLVLT